MEKIKIGVIGLGARGRHFCDLYDGTPRSAVVAVCDRDTERVEVVKRNRGRGKQIEYFTGIDRMLAEAEIDAVIIATNDAHHTEPALKALQHDKHVMVEKPLAQTLADCRKIMAAAKKSKGIFMVGLELRHCVLFEKMKQIIDKGDAGKIIMGIGLDNVSVGGNYYFHGRGRRKEYYKSLLLQKACHSLDLLNWFMGSRPARVFASGSLDVFGGNEPNDKRCRDCEKKNTCPYFIDYRRFGLDYGVAIITEDGCVYARETDLDDNSQLLIEYKNGARATFTECHFTPEYSREFTLIGEKAKMYGFYNNEGEFLIRVTRRHATEHIDEYRPRHTGGSHGGGDLRMMAEFFDCIKTRQDPRSGLQAAYDSTVLAICAEESIAKKKPIDIPLMEV